MRWSIIRLIWVRELKDQLRDRRTVLMMVALPLVLYPLVGLGLMQFAVGFTQKSSVIGIRGVEYLPPSRISSYGDNPLPATVWLTLIPGGGLDQVAGAAVMSSVAERQQDYPALLTLKDGTATFLRRYFDSTREQNAIVVKTLSSNGSEAEGPSSQEEKHKSPSVDRTVLDTKQVDVLIDVPANFMQTLEGGGKPALAVLGRDGDDRSRLAMQRAYEVLTNWKRALKETRLVRRGLPFHFDNVFDVYEPERSQASTRLGSENLFEMLARIVPFMVIIWSLAGALYPAVDLCAGEKERGTMETLLISPAQRQEIVWGKFLAIWVFSAATALLNLIGMAVTTWHFRGLIPLEALRPASMAWCVLLLLPMSAFFSALCLAVGAYARSSKEGQYYLMPLFLLTMPLVFLSLAPGVELNAFYSMVPITGVALLMQRLMSTGLPDRTAYFYFIPVLAPMTLYGWLALRWAVEQFHREEVLFREAERLDWKLWVRHLFRDKEPWPSTGQALFCFGLILLLRWLSFGIGGGLPLLARSAISSAAFLVAPALLMALFLTTRPRQTLGLVPTSLAAMATALVLGLLLFPPLAEITQWVLSQFPGLKEMLKEHHPLTEELMAFGGDQPQSFNFAHACATLLALAILPAACEELVFRGFIYSGLRRRYAPWKAIGLSSFLFAAYHLNVFQFLPALLMGLVLAMLAERSGSLVPPMILHLLNNSLPLGMVILEVALRQQSSSLTGESMVTVRLMFACGCALIAFIILWRLARKIGQEPATRRNRSSLP